MFYVIYIAARGWSRVARSIRKTNPLKVFVKYTDKGLIWIMSHQLRRADENVKVMLCHQEYTHWWCKLAKHFPGNKGLSETRRMSSRISDIATLNFYLSWWTWGQDGKKTLNIKFSDLRLLNGPNSSDITRVTSQFSNSFTTNYTNFSIDVLRFFFFVFTPCCHRQNRKTSTLMEIMQSH